MIIHKPRSSATPFVKLMALAILLGAVVFGVFGGYQGLVFSPIEGPSDFIQRLAPLFAIALFIERALEVFIPAWRGEDEQRLKAEAASPRPSGSEEVAAAGAFKMSRATLSDLQDKSDTTQADVAAFKAETRKIAGVAGLTLGVIVSAVGVRALSLFFYPDSIDVLAPWQKNVFAAVDVFVTGALIGGGADGLHQIVKVFTNFMSTTSDKIEAQRPTKAT